MAARSRITIFNPDGSIHLEIDNPLSWGMDTKAPTLLYISLKEESGHKKFIRTTLPFIVERWGED